MPQNFNIWSHSFTPEATVVHLKPQLHVSQVFILRPSFFLHPHPLFKKKLISLYPPFSLSVPSPFWFISAHASPTHPLAWGCLCYKGRCDYAKEPKILLILNVSLKKVSHALVILFINYYWEGLIVRCKNFSVAKRISLTRISSVAFAMALSRAKLIIDHSWEF